MRHGALVYLGAFFALAMSWAGFVLTPQMQVGQMVATNTLSAGARYPVARPGLAQQGLQVYRANGCAYCHSQQVWQRGTVFDVMLTDGGTNQAGVVAALQAVMPRLSRPEALGMLEGLPKVVVKGVSREEAESAIKKLTTSGAKAALWIEPVGPDMARGWGRRRTVPEDFLYDYPVMLGGQRVGPDLANIGVRQPDERWHLRHLYAPGSVVAGSVMPGYPYLFEERRVVGEGSPDALAMSGQHAPAAGYEVVPKPEAKALAAYLVSLRAEAPLFTAPLSLAASGAGGASATNGAPVAGGGAR
jgi:cbb3-type cytochrome oxidase cytochrome c subunit